MLLYLSVLRKTNINVCAFSKELCITTVILVLGNLSPITAKAMAAPNSTLTYIIYKKYITYVNKKRKGSHMWNLARPFSLNFLKDLTVVTNCCYKYLINYIVSNEPM